MSNKDVEVTPINTHVKETTLPKTVITVMFPYPTVTCVTTE